MSYYKEALKAVDISLRRFPHNVDLAISICNSVNENQMAIKRWLTAELSDICEMRGMESPSVLVHAGWFGLVGDMIRTSSIKPHKVCIMDKDPMCEVVGKIMYPKIKHKWGKLEEFDFEKDYFDIVVIPSCEHFSDDVLNNFLSKKPDNVLVCLTSNDMYAHEDHVNCKGSVHQFANDLKLKIYKECELKVGQHTRFMIFGV